MSGLVWPLGIMTAISALIVLLAWRDVQDHQRSEKTHFTPKNPFEIKTALQMGALLAVVMFLAKALTEWFGDTGVYLLAGISGVGDVDAITLALSRMAGTDIASVTAIIAITIAAIINTVTKGSLATGVGGARLGRYVGLRFALMILSGLAGLGIVVWPFTIG
ncbi:MAG: DUF4010 domain-containing protein [Gammaproteobacteria bacterium]|nr:DUF4010 domain-containing protein [Gammaproteobacteria bacterium]